MERDKFYPKDKLLEMQGKKYIAIGQRRRTVELNKEQRVDIINEIDTKTRYAKFINTDAVVLSSRAAQYCLEHIEYYEQKIKELTEENERLQKQLDDRCDRCIENDKARTVMEMTKLLIRRLPIISPGVFKGIANEMLEGE